MSSERYYDAMMHRSLDGVNSNTECLRGLSGDFRLREIRLITMSFSLREE
jgi:hypothetical protein